MTVGLEWGRPEAGSARPHGGRVRRLRSLAGIATLATIGVAIFVALGIWQVERRAWKLDLIAQVDQRIHASPVAVPGREAWGGINARDDAYRHVRLRGHFLHDRETLVQAVTERGGGFWVVTPLQTEDGTTVLINRGFVPSERREAASRAAGNPGGTVEVAGLLRISEPGGAFLRTNDAAANRWYSRDVAAIASARGLSGTAPFFIDADAVSSPAGGPVGGLTVVSFANSHLVYALTWFALAAMLSGWILYILRHEWRSRQNRLNDL